MTETTAAPAIAEAKPNHGLSLADAVAAMQANRESAAAPTPVQPAVEPAADASNPEPGETTEADSVEGEEPEAEATADETAEEVTEEPSGEGVELAEDSKLILPDGSEWTAKELAEGVLRHKDYTRKTQALAEERRTLDADRKVVQDKARELETGMQAERAQIAAALKEAQAQRDRYAQSVDEVEKALNQQGAEWARIDWEIEAQRDPNWQLKFARFQKWQHAMEVTRAEKAELDAKRKAINVLLKERGQKVSFTHLVAWAIIEATKQHPVMVRAFEQRDGKPFAIEAAPINLGIAVDVERKDGSLFPTAFSGRAIDHRQLERGTIWVIQDIAERKQLQDSVRRALSERETILEAAVVGIAHLQGRQVRWINAVLEQQMLGYAQGELVDRDVERTYAQADDYVRIGQEFPGVLASRHN